MNNSNIHPNEDYAHTLKLLVSMGFNDMEKNRKAVREANGLLHSSIELLSGEGTERKTTPSSTAKASIPVYTFPKLSQQQAEKVLQCAAMGFDDEGKIRHALILCKWEVEAAVNRLVEDDGILDSGYSSLEKGTSITPLPERSSSLSKPAYSAPDWQTANTQITNTDSVLQSSTNTPFSMYSNSNLFAGRPSNDYAPQTSSFSTKPQSFGSAADFSFNTNNNQWQFNNTQSSINPFAAQNSQLHSSTETKYDAFRNPNVATLSVFDQPKNWTPPTNQSENPFEETKKPKYAAAEFDPFADTNAL